MIHDHYPSSIKNGVRNVKLPLDQDALWKKINSKLRNKRRRKLGVYFILILVLSGFGIMYENSKHNSFSYTNQIGLKEGFHENVKIKICKDDVLFQVLHRVNQTRPKRKSHGNILLSQSIIKNAPDNQNNEIKKVVNTKVLNVYPVVNPIIEKINMEPLTEINTKIKSVATATRKSVDRQVMVSDKFNLDKSGFVRFYAGMGFVTKSLSYPKNKPELWQEVNYIKSTETVLEDKCAGFSFIKPIYTNLSLSFGLEYREVTERFYFTDVERQPLANVNTYRANRVSITQITQYHSNRLLDLHVDFEYVFFRHPSFFVTGIAGLSNTLVSSFESTRLTENTNPIVVRETRNFPGIYHFRIGSSITYPLSPKISLIFQPLMSFGLNYFQRQEKEIYQKYSTYSCMIGVVQSL